MDGLSRATVQVFTIPLAGWSSSVVNELRRVLTEAERSRADRFVTEDLRRRFVVSHGAMRLILGRCIGKPADQLRIVTTDKGKPRLTGTASTGLEFNLSHSGELAVLAVGCTRSVGVDVERLREVPNSMGLAERLFTGPEAAAIRATPASRRSAAFLRVWTCKESYVKALGQGLHLPFDRFGVEPDLRRPARLLWCTEPEHGPHRWRLRDLVLPSGYLGTIAIEGTDSTVMVRQNAM